MRVRPLHDAILIGTLVFFAVYASPLLTAVPLPWYLPLARTWVFTVKPTTLGMGWYGQTTFATLAALFAATITWAVTRKRDALSSTRARVATILLVVGTAAVMGLFLTELVNRVPKAEPLPAWYQPR